MRQDFLCRFHPKQPITTVWTQREHPAPCWALKICAKVRPCLSCHRLVLLFVCLFVSIDFSLKLCYLCEDVLGLSLLIWNEPINQYLTFVLISNIINTDRHDLHKQKLSALPTICRCGVGSWERLWQPPPWLAEVQHPGDGGVSLWFQCALH